MTAPRTNRIIGQPTGRPAFVQVGDDQVPTNVDDYCAWLNAKFVNCGLRYAVVEKEGKRTVERIDDRGTKRPKEIVTREETQAILRNAGLKYFGDQE